jgi:hypothetical protein
MFGSSYNKSIVAIAHGDRHTFNRPSSVCKISEHVRYVAGDDIASITVCSSSIRILADFKPVASVTDSDSFEKLATMTRVRSLLLIAKASTLSGADDRIGTT